MCVVATAKNLAVKIVALGEQTRMKLFAIDLFELPPKLAAFEQKYDQAESKLG